MKRYKEENNQELRQEEFINDIKESQANNEDYSIEEKKSYKRLDEEEEKDPYINENMKKFRTIIGGLCLIFVIIFSFMFMPNQAYRDNLTSGIITGVNAGDVLSETEVKLDSMDAEVEIVNGYGNIEISIWNFVDVEDNDYVQVYIDGVAQGAPFSIKHRPVKISVPDKAVIQVQGVRDGSNNGITYGVFFNKTGETYLNNVALNGTNTYTIISK